jgi:6-phospho-3-hexuloisomerase
MMVRAREDYVHVTPLPCIQGSDEDPAHDDLRGAIALILSENAAVLGRIDRPSVGRVAAAIATASRVFVSGEEGCGPVALMAAVRLMHLGFRVHVFGEATTPPMAEGDVAVAFSAFGDKGTALLMAGRAHACGASVIAVTAVRDSPLAIVADRVLHVDVARVCIATAEARSQPISTALFEQASLLLFDAMARVLAGSLHWGDADDEIPVPP